MNDLRTTPKTPDMDRINGQGLCMVARPANGSGKDRTMGWHSRGFEARNAGFEICARSAKEWGLK